LLQLANQRSIQVSIGGTDGLLNEGINLVRCNVEPGNLRGVTRIADVQRTLGLDVRLLDVTNKQDGNAFAYSVTVTFGAYETTRVQVQSLLIAGQTIIPSRRGDTCSVAEGAVAMRESRY
jgi:hypothetical protein